MATDAPLLPHQLARVAQRAGLGIARTGGLGETTSGDLFLAFATGNRGLEAPAWGIATPATLGLRKPEIGRLYASATAAQEFSPLPVHHRARRLAGCFRRRIDAYMR